MLITPTVVSHFTMYVNQAIVLYTLNLCRDICQFFLNKTWKSIKRTKAKALPGQH